MSWLPGVHAAPNIQDDAALYELENRALDPDGLLFAAMEKVQSWEDQIVVDLGAGTGFWSVPFAQSARHVFAVEPHGPSRLLAMERFASLGCEEVSVLAGSAAQTHLADDSVDVVHARFAYFWGAGCEPGLREVERICKPGGLLFVIDNDLRQGQFARWLEQVYPRDIASIEEFWEAEGFARTNVRSCWRFETREDLEAVVELEFRDAAPVLLAEHEGLEVDYGYVIYHKRFG